MSSRGARRRSTVRWRGGSFRLVPGCDWYHGCCMELSHTHIVFWWVFFPFWNNFQCYVTARILLHVPLLYGWQRKHLTFPGECGSHPEATRVILEDTDRWGLLWLRSGTLGWMMDRRLLSSPTQHFFLLFYAAKSQIQTFGIISRNWAHYCHQFLLFGKYYRNSLFIDTYAYSHQYNCFNPLFCSP